MTDTTLGDSQNTAPIGTEQEGRGLLKSEVTPEVFVEVRRAFEQFGFTSVAAAVRTVMTVFARSREVQDLIRRDLYLALRARSDTR